MLDALILFSNNEIANIGKGDHSDIFILSKGHAGILQYIMLEDKNIIDSEEVNKYCTNSGPLGCHPDYGTPGVVTSTGSLGHGLPIACGIAFSNMTGLIQKNIHCVISDGELQEGSTWEAILFAGSRRLSNLICYVDNNNFQSLEKMDLSHPSIYPIQEKFKTFGWDFAVVDGHNSLEIVRSYHEREMSKPLVIVCKTIKGKGVSYMENQPIWHFRSPNHQEYMIALDELKG